MFPSLLVALGLVVVAAPTPADTNLVSTSQALALEQESQARATVDEFLAREEIAAELIALGVDPEVARLRAESLSGSEVEQLAGRIEDAPAGGVSVIGVLGVTFLVLLILELVGVINIFNKF